MKKILTVVIISLSLIGFAFFIALFLSNSLKYEEKVLTKNDDDTSIGDTTCIEEYTVQLVTNKSVQSNELGTYYRLSNNTLEGMGANSFHTLGKDEYYDDWVKIAENVIMYDFNTTNLIYLTKDGSVYGSGNIEGGVLQIETNDNNRFIDLSTPKLLIEDVVNISLGCRFVIVLKRDKTVWFWGETENGQSGTISDQIVDPVKIIDNAIQIKAVMYTSFWIDEKMNLWAMGDNSYGQIGNGDEGDGFPTKHNNCVTDPYLVLENCNSIYSSNEDTIIHAITTGGIRYLWGGNMYSTPTQETENTLSYTHQEMS